MKNSRTFKRTDRVGQQTLEILAGLILTDVKDPRVENVQLTAVDVTNDFKTAKVYWVDLLDKGFDADVQAGLERSAGYMRKVLGERIRLKNTPELLFVYDESVARGRRMDEILSDLTIPGEEE